MQVLLRTDNHIPGSAELTRRVDETVTDSLKRFEPQVTRVEVHLTDLNSAAKETDNDKRCVMEARLSGLKPITVSHDAATIDQAVDGAADTLIETLDRTLGRIGQKKGRTPYGGDPSI
jgi:hypothetical protein